MSNNLSDQTVIQLVAGWVIELMRERKLPNTHENQVACTREILDDLVKHGIVSSYTWVGDAIEIQVAKN
jgi:hypothetical protein